MKKILIIVPSGKGTIASVSYNLYEALRNDKNILVQVVNLWHEMDDQYIFGNSINLKRSKNNNILHKVYYTIYKIIKLRQIKKKFKPDITISTLNACTSLSILSLGKDKKIGIFHSPLNQTKILGKYVYLMSLISYKFLYSKLDRIYCVSEEVKYDIINNLGSIDKNKISVVYNIHNINNIKLLANRPLNNLYSELFNIDVILFVGQLYSIKAPDRLVRSFAHFVKTYKKPINLVFMGEDKFDTITHLTNIAKFYNIQNYITFIGNQSNPYQFIKNAKCLVSTSKSEGLPGVIIESLILGTPVITTNSSIGVWEILSCKDAYDKHLSDIYIAKKGIITPNKNLELSDKNMDIEVDDIWISNALDMILSNSDLYNSMKTNPFEFESEVETINYIKFII